MSTSRRERITFKATKVVSKAVEVEFRNSNGQLVHFKAHADVPKVVRVNFLANKEA